MDVYSLLRAACDKVKPGKFQFKQFNRSKFHNHVVNAQTNKVSERFSQVAPIELCYLCVGEMHGEPLKFAKSHEHGTRPTAGWVMKAKSTRFTGSEKAFSDQLGQTVGKLEK